MNVRHHEFNAIFSTCKGFRSVSFVRFHRKGNGIDDNLANSRLRTGMQNFWFGCDIPVDFCHDQKCLIMGRAGRVKYSAFIRFWINGAQILSNMLGSILVK